MNPDRDAFFVCSSLWLLCALYLSIALNVLFSVYANKDLRG